MTKKTISHTRPSSESIPLDSSFFRALVEKSDEVIITLNGEKKIVSWNRGAQKTFGYSADDVTGEHFSVLVPAHLHNKYKTKLQQLLHSEQDVSRETFTVTGLHKNRAEFPLEASVTRWESEAGVFLTGIAHSITDHQRAEEELNLLEQVRVALARELDLSKAIRTIFEALIDVFGYTEVSLLLLENDTLIPVHEIGFDHLPQQIGIDQGVVGRVARTGEPVLLEDIRTAPEYLNFAGTEAIVSEVCVPLFTGDQVAGVINIESTGKLTEADLNLMVALSQHVSAALERATLYTEVKSRAAHLELITQVGQKTTAILELDELLQQAANLIHDTFGYYQTTIFLVEENEIVLSAATMESAHPLIGQLRLPVGKGSISGWVAQTGEPLIVPDVSQEPLYYLADFATKTRSEMAVPIHLKERILGVLNVEEDGLNAFSETDRFTLQTVAGQLAVTIENARLYEQAQQEIAERKHAEEALSQLAAKLDYQAKHDHLTGLPNRLYFERTLKQTIEAAKETGLMVGLLYVDLDRFKRINDTLGHDTGDALLQQVARRLENQIRSTDMLARMGGDEFAVILGNLEVPQDAGGVARRLLGALEEAITVEGHELFVTASIGISLYPRDGESAEVLLQKADTALYRSKDLGRDTYQIYTGDMDDTAHERLLLENQLRGALDRDELKLYYQPLVDINNGKIVGVEGLLRWSHPELGMVSPGRFIPIAEESGLIIPIGTWVIQEACCQGQRWQQSDHHLTVAVNISAVQFQKADFIPIVSQALQESGLQANHLYLELTESLLFHDPAMVKDKLTTLKSLGLGVGIAIDDFGTGHASLSHLQRPQVDILKIDQSFVRDIGSVSQKAAHDEAIVKSIITLAHDLGMTVVAEGVETRKQLTFLHQAGCDIIQGFLFSPAVPVDELEEFLSREWPGWNVDDLE
jgi:diguanylate cyclase (GGDEF)-like protein/PAS domain S-box-containing protein